MRSGCSMRRTLDTGVTVLAALCVQQRTEASMIRPTQTPTTDGKNETTFPKLKLPVRSQNLKSQTENHVSNRQGSLVSPPDRAEQRTLTAWAGAAAPVSPTDQGGDQLPSSRTGGPRVWWNKMSDGWLPQRRVSGAAGKDQIRTGMQVGQSCEDIHRKQSPHPSVCRRAEDETAHARQV